MQWDLELQVCLPAKSWFTLANWVSMETALHTGTQASSLAPLMASPYSPMEMGYANEG